MELSMGTYRKILYSYVYVLAVNHHVLKLFQNTIISLRKVNVIRVFDEITRAVNVII